MCWWRLRLMSRICFADIKRNFRHLSGFVLTLQHTATHCSTHSDTLQHSATNCDTLQHPKLQTSLGASLCFSSLGTQLCPERYLISFPVDVWRVSRDVSCDISRGLFSHCNTLQYSDTLQHTATRCNTLQHTATHKTSDISRGSSLFIQTSLGTHLCPERYLIKFPVDVWEV